jgi:hypothetical protein
MYLEDIVAVAEAIIPNFIGHNTVLRRIFSSAHTKILVRDKQRAWVAYDGKKRVRQKYRQA